MNRFRHSLRWTLTLLALPTLVACTSPGNMTPQQKEAYELRRYCERTNDVNKCHGYMGFV